MLSGSEDKTNMADLVTKLPIPVLDSGTQTRKQTSRRTEAAQFGFHIWFSASLSLQQTKKKTLIKPDTPAYV